MTKDEGDTPDEAAIGRSEHGDTAGLTEIRVGTGYVVGQLARALTASRKHADKGVRARAARRVEEWTRVFVGMLRGVLDVGSRTPVAGTPAWATLKVVTGGFATGELLADGPLRGHERELLARLGSHAADGARAALNAHYLGEDGLGELNAMLESGDYRIGLPKKVRCWWSRGC